MKVTVLRDSHQMALSKPPSGVRELRMTREPTEKASPRWTCLGCLHTAFICAFFLLLGIFVSQMLLTYCRTTWTDNKDSYNSPDSIIPKSSFISSSGLASFPEMDQVKSLTDSLLMASILKSIQREMVAEIEKEGFIIVEPDPVEFVATQVETYQNGAMLQMTFGNRPSFSLTESVDGDIEDLRRWSLLVREALTQQEESEPVQLNPGAESVNKTDDGIEVAADGDFSDFSQDLAQFLQMPSSSTPISSATASSEQELHHGSQDAPPDSEESSTDLTPEAVEKYFDVPDFIGGAKPSEQGKLPL